MLKGEIAKSNFGTYNKGYYAELRYKAANPFKPGSYTIYTAYRNILQKQQLIRLIDMIWTFRMILEVGLLVQKLLSALNKRYVHRICGEKKPSDATSTHVKQRVQYSVFL